jgi:hypothetical protein
MNIFGSPVKGSLALQTLQQHIHYFPIDYPKGTSYYSIAYKQ